MGAISKKLTARFRKAQKPRGDLRRQAAAAFATVPTDVNSVETLVRSGRDPLHAAYVAAQNFTSFFAEAVSPFAEFDPYCRIVGPAQEEYMPGGPPMSPLTASYFTTWAFFDVRFGPDRETVGTCLLDVADLMGMDPFVAETIRRLQGSRMGVYEHLGTDGGRCRLRELVTDEEFRCRVPAGYRGRPGELWYVRLCPPLLGLVDYHVGFTTPYVLLGFGKADWAAYLNKSVLGAADTRAALHEFLKFGREPNAWNEFIFLAYYHHRTEAIFLTGLPDVKGSLPHA